MHNADLYQQSNSLQKRDVTICLEKYASKFKWKQNNNRILDIGSGDGSVTNIILKRFIPNDFKLLGCDKSESMVNFANDHHGNEQIYFFVLDITKNIPKEMWNGFGHVFSFYALHWVKDQERAFKNIFRLMDHDGECFLVFLASHPIYDVYRTLARNNKWSTYLHDVEKYVTPSHDLQYYLQYSVFMDVSQIFMKIKQETDWRVVGDICHTLGGDFSKDPASKIRNMMENIGFINVDVEIREMLFAYDNLDSMRKAVTAINPFIIPKDQNEDFHKDYMEVLRKITKTETSADVTFYYKLLVVYGHKPLKILNF